MELSGLPVREKERSATEAAVPLSVPARVCLGQGAGTLFPSSR